MPLSYDSDGAPKASVELLRAAQEIGGHVVCIICGDEDIEAEELSSVSFMAVTSFIPRTGDVIRLDNGKPCEVNKVYFAVGRFKGQHALVPTVYATLVGE